MPTTKTSRGRPGRSPIARHAPRSPTPSHSCRSAGPWRLHPERRVLDLGGRANLGELERDPGRGDIDERPIDRPELLVGREDQVADDVRSDPHLDRDRRPSPARASEPAFGRRPKETSPIVSANRARRRRSVDAGGPRSRPARWRCSARTTAIPAEPHESSRTCSASRCWTSREDGSAPGCSRRGPVGDWTSFS